MNAISRRDMLRGVALTLGSAVLASCGPTPTATPAPKATAAPTPAPPKAVTLKLALWGSADYIKAWEGMTKIYMDQTPGVTIEILSVPSDQYYQKMQVMLAGGQPLDAMIVEDKMLRYFASNGVILPIDEYITEEDKKKFFAATLGPFQYQGKTYGLPRRVNNTAIYYNKTMFDKAGVKIPSAGWTQAECLEAARVLTKKGSDGKTTVYGIDFLTVMQHVAPWIWSNGGEYFNQDLTKCVMTQKETVETYQTFANLIRDGIMPTTDVRDAMESYTGMFMSQKLALIGGCGVWLVPTFRKIKDFEWDVLPLPAGTKGRINIVYASCFAIPTLSKNRVDAIKFVQFSTGPVAQAEEAKTPTAIPSIKEVAESKLFVDPDQPPKNMRQFLLELEGARPAADIYHPMKFLETTQAIAEELDPMWRGKRDAAASCKAAEDRVNKIIGA